MFPIRAVWGAASNVKGGSNPPFTADEFKKMYPQFFGQDQQLIPEEVLEMFLQFAHSCVKKARYHGAWEYCISLFVAHFLTLYMQSMVDPEYADATSVIAAGQSKGLLASKSVEGVSYSYDFSTAMQDLDGWAAWKLTTYGTQFATMAKMYGMGGMAVP